VNDEQDLGAGALTIPAHHVGIDLKPPG
jgi:hypothetical protein